MKKFGSDAKKREEKHVLLAKAQQTLPPYELNKLFKKVAKKSWRDGVVYSNWQMDSREILDEEAEDYANTIFPTKE